MGKNKQAEKAKIKFSYDYWKMPRSCHNYTRLLEVLIANTKDLHEEFVHYDTLYVDLEKFGLGNYKLPKGKVLILLLESGGAILWTTIRRWTPQKEKYYKGLRGQEVEIVINEK